MMDKEFWTQSSLFHEKENGTKRQKVSGWTESSNAELVMVNRNDKERSENKQNKGNGDNW